MAPSTGTLAAGAVYAANGRQSRLNLAIALNAAGACTAVLAAVGLFPATIAPYESGRNDPVASTTLGVVLAAVGIALVPEYHAGAGLAPSRISPNPPSPAH